MAVDQIGTKGLVDCSVAAADIAPGTITSAKLAGSIANAKLSNSSITVNGQSISLGASGSVPPVQWQAKVTSDGSTVTTMVAGRGYFVDNSSAAGLVKLPASAARGDIVQIKDYAGNFGTNNLTIQRNGHNIQGDGNDGRLKTIRQSVVYVYVDATKGWLVTNQHDVGDLEGPAYTSATGGNNGVVGSFCMDIGSGMNYNVAMGHDTARHVTTGSNNIMLGHSAGHNNSPSGQITTGSNNICLGNNNITNAFIKVAFTVTSDKRDKIEDGVVSHGLDFVNQLKPKSFWFRKNRESDQKHGDKRYGFYAQDILALEGSNAVVIDNKDPENLKYKGDQLIPILVKAIQELTMEVNKLKSNG